MWSRDGAIIQEDFREVKVRRCGGCGAGAIKKWGFRADALVAEITRSLSINKCVNEAETPLGVSGEISLLNPN
jgi:hypothetical protein